MVSYQNPKPLGLRSRGTLEAHELAEWENTAPYPERIFYGEEARITLNHYGTVGVSPKGLRFNSRFFPWVET
ncbi:MAG: hypothetical protein ACK4G4_12500, partial [Thermus sp.]|uniref:hypothetical protein n=1 Tax=Thermus sp. TaxID=275 RepID=UPI00391C4E63